MRFFVKNAAAAILTLALAGRTTMVSAKSFALAPEPNVLAAAETEPSIEVKVYHREYYFTPAACDNPEQVPIHAKMANEAAVAEFYPETIYKYVPLVWNLEEYCRGINRRLRGERRLQGAPWSGSSCTPGCPPPPGGCNDTSGSGCRRLADKADMTLAKENEILAKKLGATFTVGPVSIVSLGDLDEKFNTLAHLAVVKVDLEKVNKEKEAVTLELSGSGNLLSSSTTSFAGDSLSGSTLSGGDSRTTAIMQEAFELDVKSIELTVESSTLEATATKDYNTADSVDKKYLDKMGAALDDIVADMTGAM